MVSTMRSRPTHYEMLGLTPDATDEEIRRASAREVSQFRPRAFGGIAEVGIAYETLRDPAKRRAYDASLRPTPVPEPEPQWAPFLMRASAHPVETRSADPLHRPAPAPSAPARAEPPVDRRVAAIAASLRELSKPDAYEEPSAPLTEPESVRAAEKESDADLEPVLQHILAVGHAEKDRLHSERHPLEWKRPVLTAGALVLTVGVIGAWAGSQAGNAVEAQQLERGITAPLPPAKAASQVEADASPTLTFAAAGADTARDRRARAAAAVRRVSHPLPPQPERALSGKELEELPPVEVAPRTNQGDDQASTQTVVESPVLTATPAAAKLPLSNAVVARTIGRIGYACGQVAAVVEGDGPGVYKVTCTSGHSYRAAPVRGRYHFSQLGGR